MEAERWQRVDALFEAALDLPAEEWTAYLRQQTEDEDLRREVERLLALDQAAQSFLAGPVSPQDLETATEVEPRSITTFGKGRFEPLQVLAEGPPLVYLAQPAEGGPEVVLKLFPRAPVLAWETLRRWFDRLRALSIPALAQPLDLEVLADQRALLVLEAVPGTPIDRHCDHLRLPLGRRIDVFLEVCHHAQSLHRQNWFHGALHPSNLLVDDEGIVRILDTGLRPWLEGREAEDFQPREDIAVLLRLLFRLLTGIPFAPQGSRPSQALGNQTTEFHHRAHLCRTTPRRLLRRLQQADSLFEEEERITSVDELIEAVEGRLVHRGLWGSLRFS